jgi:hypothetical protein
MDPHNPQIPLDLAITLALFGVALGWLLGVVTCSRRSPRLVDRSALDAVVDDYADALRDLEERDAPRVIADNVAELSPQVRERMRRQQATRGRGA